ncbi:hypothetical protein JL916_12335 [Staphylococcus pseudintermedius]|uniref:DUF6932 family protein n=2 Tax=Staphylococcus pseudintermedius TaxID=283734 RepID=UPI0001F6BFA4|nr:hypothetical protein [Staphylococcus pseudintermedius]ADV05394.1 hypothetical protein SPSINT_0866 [Staphylococcus pseudintermedius HKU10-03]EGQ1656359.1 hypothetical protein [Staphylococcus pseudintermedius]EGQ2939472.1 hypothetical protein [Staphylococcus pseudintermedius]EGQ3141151.1 hypothetical protein [Staphylococcus pseudintermedius]EGQ3420092.1 hypothetical protein [Staphylococcus pseudintermedius]
MHFDSHGNLVGGIIQSNINVLKDELVDTFDTSNTRERNFKSLLELIELLKVNNLSNGIASLWIDGSFCTKKINPNDIDLVILLKPYNKSARTIDYNANKIRNLFLEKYLDIYIAYDSKYLHDDDYIKQVMTELKAEDSTFNKEEFLKALLQNRSDIDYQMKYWMGQFGFDRNRRSKGLISIEGESL